MKIPVLISLLVLCVSAANTVANEDPCWKDNKLTPDQPFPAQVIAVLNRGWGGYSLLLENIKKEGDYYIANVSPHKLIYSPLAKENPEFPKPGKGGIYATLDWIFLSPGVHVSEFSWSLGGWPLGASAEQDVVRMAYKFTLDQKKAEQGGADQPATAPQLKPSSDENPNPESKPRPE